MVILRFKSKLVIFFARSKAELLQGHTWPVFSNLFLFKFRLQHLFKIEIDKIRTVLAKFRFLPWN